MILAALEAFRLATQVGVKMLDYTKPGGLKPPRNSL